MRLALLAVLLLPMALWAAGTSPADFICGDVTDQLQKQQCIEKAQHFTRDFGVERVTKETPFWVGWIWPMGWWLVYYGFGLVIGSYVYRDAKKRDWVFLGIRPLWWVVLVLFEPALGLLAYWAAHYSKLAQTYAEASPQSAPP